MANQRKTENAISLPEFLFPPLKACQVAFKQNGDIDFTGSGASRNSDGGRQDIFLTVSLFHHREDTDEALELGVIERIHQSCFATLRCVLKAIALETTKRNATKLEA